MDGQKGAGKSTLWERNENVVEFAVRPRVQLLYIFVAEVGSVACCDIAWHCGAPRHMIMRMGGGVYSLVPPHHMRTHAQGGEAMHGTVLARRARAI